MRFKWHLQGKACTATLILVPLRLTRLSEGDHRSLPIQFWIPSSAVTCTGNLRSRGEYGKPRIVPHNFDRSLSLKEVICDHVFHLVVKKRSLNPQKNVDHFQNFS